MFTLYDIRHGNETTFLTLKRAYKACSGFVRECRRDGIAYECQVYGLHGRVYFSFGEPEPEEYTKEDAWNDYCERKYKEAKDARLFGEW